MLTLNSLFFKEFTVDCMGMESAGNRSFGWFWIGVMVCIGGLLLPGCMEATNEPVDTYLVRVGGSTLTVSEFNEVFEISKTAYSHSDTMDPGVVSDIKLRLLNQLIEEMILIERAGMLGITVSDAELESEIEKIRADYPEGVFEEMLLEAAVSFEVWKKRLKMQLTARKFIQMELAAKVSITSEEVAEYYATHFADEAGSKPEARPPDDRAEGLPQEAPGKKRSPGITDAMILRMLRNQKVQAAYAEWMKANRSKVTIDINSRQWEAMTQKHSSG